MKTEYDISFKARSLTDYIDVIEKYYIEWGVGTSPSDGFKIWFRGMEDDYSLVPVAFRTNNNRPYNEFSIYNTFLSIYKNYTTERFDNANIELFSFMQHYGIPTRLLDWTESYLFALFFALDSVKEKNQPVVWVINTGALNSFSLNAKIEGPIVVPNKLIKARFDLIGCIDLEDLRKKKYFSIDNKYEDFFNSGLIDYPIAYHPKSAGNNRIISQKGMFTVHGRLRSGIEVFFKQKNKSSFLKKIIIEKETIKSIKESLRRAGITPRTVYPDLHGLAKELKTDY